MSQAQGAFESLRAEHDVAGRLLGRLEEFSDRIQGGRSVAPEVIRRGVGLLDAYLHRVHVRQFDVDLWPTIRAAAHPECGGALRQVLSSHEAMRIAAHRLIELTVAQGAGRGDTDKEIAVALRRLVEADTDANRFEERHPFVCLTSSLSREGQRTARRKLDRHAPIKHALEENIERFLARTA